MLNKPNKPRAHEEQAGRKIATNIPTIPVELSHSNCLFIK